MAGKSFSSKEKVVLLIFLIILAIGLILIPLFVFDVIPTERNLIMFDTSGGSQISSIRMFSGRTLQQPTDPVKEGYVFVGWFTTSGASITFPLSVRHSQTLHARWAPIPGTERFNVTFDNSTVTKLIGSYFEKPEEPTRAGYRFGGWYNDSALNNSTEFPIVITRNLTIFAKWIAVFSIEFETNGGNSITTMSADVGTLLNSQTPIRAGYRFDGWYINSALSTAAIFPLELTENIKLYAAWVRQFTLTFQTSGGSVITPMAVDIGSKIYEPNAPTMWGAVIFGGWFFDFDLTMPVGFPVELIEDITIFAEWIGASIIAFQTYGGSEIQSLVIYEGNSVAALETPTRGDALFGGWYFDNTFSDVVTLPFTPNRNMILFARWQYEISFETFDGTNVDGIIRNERTQISAPTQPVYGTAIFGGWYFDSNFENRVNFPFVLEGNTTIFVKWQYELILMSSSGVASSFLQAIGSQVTAPSAPTRTDAQFSNWYTNAAFTQRVQFPFTLSDHATIYARWQFTITFNSNGGNAITSQNFVEGATTNSLPIATRNNMTFGGWRFDAELTHIANAPLTLARNITLYAQWQFTATFNANGGSAIAPIVVNMSPAATINAPAEPTRAGAIFLGWHLNSTLTQPAIFPLAMSANRTLFASWFDLNQTITNTQNEFSPTRVNANYRVTNVLQIGANSTTTVVSVNGRKEKISVGNVHTDYWLDNENRLWSSALPGEYIAIRPPAHHVAGVSFPLDSDGDIGMLLMSSLRDKVDWFEYKGNGQLELKPEHFMAFGALINAKPNTNIGIVQEVSIVVVNNRIIGYSIAWQQGGNDMRNTFTFAYGGVVI
jgi:uncharacterized repeat protein (TIGR02543 family)